ncbi:tyrosine-type recombinase/integrase [Mesorhizobium sp. 1B3]|uniref:tyrosine-type recombinase/integrase n=1 Tax=Mesorhizobium sp. 1B3 TaxID=3243599 RepID=UPI003D958B31
MSKTLTEAAVSTRNARSKLSKGVHWRGLNADVHLGYRKGKRAGRWLVRWYVGNQKYQQETIGAADDALEADGKDCLTFDQAKARALETVKDRKAEARASEDGPAATVRSVVEAYIGAREAREESQTGEAPKKRDAKNRLTKHVLSAEIAEIALHALTETDLEKWKSGLSTNLAQDTVQRLINDFKAALNAGALKHRKNLAAEIPLVIKNGLKAGEASAPTARDKQALPDAEIRRIIQAAREVDEAEGWEGDLLRLVVLLAATGGRFSQARRNCVADVQAAQGRLMMPVSRKGRGKKKVSHIAVRVGEDVIAELRPAIAGRRGAEPLLERWRHKQVPGANGRPQWVRDRRGPWLNASELTRPWQQIIEKAGLSADVVPYALRHSSIVRQLRAGLPVRLVAALHDTSSEMIEAHYAAAIVDALDSLAAGAVVPLVDPDERKVIPLRAGQA